MCPCTVPESFWEITSRKRAIRCAHLARPSGWLDSEGHDTEQEDRSRQECLTAREKRLPSNPSSNRKMRSALSPEAKQL